MIAPLPVSHQNYQLKVHTAEATVVLLVDLEAAVDFGPYVVNCTGFQLVLCYKGVSMHWIANPIDRNLRMISQEQGQLVPLRSLARIETQTT